MINLLKIHTLYIRHPSKDAIENAAIAKQIANVLNKAVQKVRHSNLAQDVYKFELNLWTDLASLSLINPDLTNASIQTLKFHNLGGCSDENKASENKFVTQKQSLLELLNTNKGSNYQTQEENKNLLCYIEQELIEVSPVSCKNIAQLAILSTNDESYKIFIDFGMLDKLIIDDTNTLNFPKNNWGKYTSLFIDADNLILTKPNCSFINDAKKTALEVASKARSENLVCINHIEVPNSSLLKIIQQDEELFNTLEQADINTITTKFNLKEDFKQAISNQDLRKKYIAKLIREEYFGNIINKTISHNPIYAVTDRKQLALEQISDIFNVPLSIVEQINQHELVI